MVSVYHRLVDVKVVMVIKQKWSDMIRTGFKTMELRPCRFRKYEGQLVGFATSGSHVIWGVGRISKSTLLDEHEMFTPKLILQHRAEPKDLVHIRAALSAKGVKTMPWKRIYGLSLQDVLVLPEPIPYHHPRGAISLVRLSGNKVFQQAMVNALNQATYQSSRS